MTTTALVIIEAAYARSTGNDPGKLATDAELLGRLDRTFQTFFALAARQRPDDFLDQPAWTLGSVPAQVSLPNDLIEIRRIQNAAGKKVHLIPSTEVDRLWHIAPSVYRIGTVLYSRNRPGDPVANEILTAWVLNAAVPVTTLGQIIDLRFPIRHVELLVNDLALYLDTKDEARDEQQYKKLVQDQAFRLAAFAQEYNLDASAIEYGHAPITRVSAKDGA